MRPETPPPAPVRLLAAAGDLLLGACCPGCRTPWWGLCPGCRAALAGRGPSWVTSAAGAGHLDVVSCGEYDRLLRNLVNAHKERGALTLAGPLGERLAVAVHALLVATAPAWPVDGLVLLVPVPSAAAAVRRRGYDATVTLARRAGRRLIGRHRVQVVPLLGQRRGTGDQAGLGAAGRAANLAGGLRLRAPAGRWRPRLAGASVVLVDDVVTTGSSLAEAARVVTGHGARVLGAATVAATPRPTTGGRRQPLAARRQRAENTV